MKTNSTTTSRRRFLASGAAAATGLSFGSLLRQHSLAAETANTPSPVNPRPAKQIVYLYMSGGMTHLDTFDVKPDAEAMIRGKTDPIKTSADDIQIGHYFPRMAKQMHHVAVINSLTSIAGAHGPGDYQMHTNYKPLGTIVHPALGAWMQALQPQAPDAEKSDLPRNVLINGGSNHPGAGYLPAKLGPLNIGSAKKGLHDVVHNGDIDQLKYALDLSAKLDVDFRESFDMQKNVKAYDDMYRDALALMQSKDLEVFDLEKENPKTRARYGPGFGDGCLLARRLIEYGVSFVEVNLGGWDNHDQIYTVVPSLCNALDQGMSSLIADLDERGMLDETLVVLTTEFGRTPRINSNDGRDHHPAAFTTILAGGGVKRGFRFGKTDETGTKIVESPLNIADFNATIAYAMGLPINQIIYSPSMRPFTVGHKGKVALDLFG